MEWSETFHDPEWTEDDIDAALDYQHEQNLICDGCGHPVDESHDDEHRVAWITERVTCWACASAERTRQQDNKAGKQAPHGTKYATRNRAKD